MHVHITALTLLRINAFTDSHTSAVNDPNDLNVLNEIDKNQIDDQVRFENLEICQRAVEVARKLFRLAETMEEKKLFRFADQLRGSGLSMPNNPVK